MTLKQLHELTAQILKDNPGAVDYPIILENKDTPHAYESRQLRGYPGFAYDVHHLDGAEAVKIGYFDGTKVFCPKK